MSIRNKFVSLEIDFGKVIKLLSRNSSIRRLVKRPKLAGKNSRNVSFKYSSCSAIKLVIASGSRSRLFTLKSRRTKCLHDFIWSATVVSASFLFYLNKNYLKRSMNLINFSTYHFAINLYFVN